jgi:excisionase family DNA binding protein
MTALTPDLRRAIADVVGEAVREALRGSNEQADASRLLDSRTVAQRLGVSARTLDRIVASGDLRPVRIGRRRFFHVETVDAFVRELGRRPAQTKRRSLKRKSGGVR